MIYIISTTNGSETLVKLGYTDNFTRRMKSYFQANPLTKIIHVFDFKNNKEFEKYFHKTHKSKYYREWYDISMLDEMLDSVELFQRNK